MAWGDASWGDGTWGDIKTIIAELYTDLYGSGHVDNQRTIDKPRDTDTYGSGFIDNERVIDKPRDTDLYGSGEIQIVLVSFVKYVSATSYTDPVYSSAITDRTSLSLIDFDLTFDANEQAWYTQWFNAYQVTKDQYDLAIQSDIAPQADDPAATFHVEWTTNTDDGVEQRSAPINVNSNELVYDVTGVPETEDGYYRVRISDYGGYNDIRNIQIGLIH